MNGFGSLQRVKGSFALFDGATAAEFEDAAKQLSTSEVREAQSIIEHARSLGLGIVSTLIADLSAGDLGDQLPSDYLDGLLVEAVDDADDDDNVLFDLVVGAVQDAFESLGVDETTIAQMFSDDVTVADAAIEAGSESALANLPDDGEPLDAFISDFVYGEPYEGEAGFDAALSSSQMKQKGKARVGSFAARKVHGKKVVYKGAWAIRKGRKVIVNKRLPNQTVRLTAKQKVAVKKAGLKARTANAIKLRVKSFKKGRKLGLY
ncbi:hypothetical protein GCM10023206_06910 [Acinetobacter puyangensis]|uniref:Uncharacterized protein n=1 Tax=Acinetobacter puyangensis TaxID=1096779 RepID=A0A240E7P0_9GAMM|nr:hypothetical protein [Acinetobacter puyangensis]SNX44229.1 hypothetical protein SAMN05421731_102390 [Acinetobacter puyangensis]